MLPALSAPHSPPLPLCVDLDGTLVRTNLIYECALACLRVNPLLFFALPFWAMRGQAYLWSRVARHAVIDAAALPYRSEVLDVIRAENSRGRRIVLATGTHRRIAEAVARYVGVFSEIIATDDRWHCTGERKATVLVQRFGANGFDYAGDSRKDLPVWYASSLAILVNAPRRMAARLNRAQIANTTLDTASRSLPVALLRALRPHQAVKNLLVFAPIFLSHRWNDWNAVRNGLLAFAAFCCASFAGYLFNDLLDLETDRAHPSKRTRPIASGSLPIQAATMAAAALTILAVLGGVAVSSTTAWTVLGYLALSMGYSTWLKTVGVVDVVLLAGLYCYRVIAGGAATGITISPWTLAFSLFLFLSLAVMKRYAELHAGAAPAHPAKRRSYSAEDKPLLVGLGSASAMISVLVIALYVNSEDVRVLYHSPKLLWLMCPVVLVWIMRLWLIAGRGQMNEDPVLYAVKDYWTYAIGIAAIGIVLLGM